MKPLPEDKPLTVELKDNQIVISIGVETLAFCSQAENGGPFEENISIIDREAWVKDIVRELLDEEEDGTTLVHRMFDKALNNTAENGSEGLEFN